MYVFFFYFSIALTGSNWGKHEIQGDLEFGQNRVRYRNLRSVRPSSFKIFTRQFGLISQFESVSKVSNKSRYSVEHWSSSNIICNSIG